MPGTPRGFGTASFRAALQNGVNTRYGVPCPVRNRPGGTSSTSSSWMNAAPREAHISWISPSRSRAKGV